MMCVKQNVVVGAHTHTHTHTRVVQGSQGHCVSALGECSSICKSSAGTKAYAGRRMSIFILNMVLRCIKCTTEAKIEMKQKKKAEFTETKFKYIIQLASNILNHKGSNLGGLIT
ncbi:hypothetical protein XELAEV_18043513mg [Xenopus laevis]|uniref:Uncharacterized protein n=1 Tax=Xenopus laevis TaxID=8355 RepID=A0A974H2X9_XENLA|nr:hypothetical protein XELAEV_18043513mg [Xenopus laevis]